jgi:hypothetical protein
VIKEVLKANNRNTSQGEGLPIYVFKGQKPLKEGDDVTNL